SQADETVISLGGQQVGVASVETRTAGADCKVSIRPSHIDAVQADAAGMGLVGTIKTTHVLRARLVHRVEVNRLRIEANAPRTSGSVRYDAGQSVKLILDPNHTVLLRD